MSEHPDREVRSLSVSDAAVAVEVLTDAFRDYPVMRYVLGSDQANHSSGLVDLVDFFVRARFLNGDPVLAVDAPDRAVGGVATLTRPGRRKSPPALAELREAVWRRLGVDARLRYEAFGAACEPFSLEEPHYHLNMIGVRRDHAGSGLGRVLLQEVHRRSAHDDRSCGVTLTTEDEGNVRLYEHFGYEVIGHVRVADALESWSFFRPDPPR